jgi:hypothetical protein
MDGPSREDLTGARSCLFGIVLGIALWLFGMAVIACAVAGCLR